MHFSVHRNAFLILVVIVIAGLTAAVVSAQDQPGQKPEKSAERKAKEALLARYKKVLKESDVLFSTGKMRESYEKLEDCLKMVNELFPLKEHPKGHLSVAHVHFLMAYTNYRRSDFNAAMDHARKALKIRRNNYPESEFPKGLTTVRENTYFVGMMYLQQGRNHEAAPYLTEALDLARLTYTKEKFPNGHPDLAVKTMACAQMYDALKDYGRSRVMYEEALSMMRRFYAPSQYPNGHPSMAPVLASLAHALDEQGEYIAAEKLHREAVKIRSAFLDPDSIDVATSKSGLASVLMKLGKNEEGERIAREVVATMEKAFPADQFPNSDMRLAAAYHQLAGLLSNQERRKEALDYHKKALAVKQKVYRNADHPQIAHSLRWIGSLLSEAGDEEGLSKLRESLAMMRRIYPVAEYPGGHPNIADGLDNLGWALFVRDKNKEAYRVLSDAISMQNRIALDNLPLLSEAESLNFVADNQDATNIFLSASRALEVDPEELYERVWSRRSVIYRVTARRRRLLQAASGASFAEQYEEYLNVRRMLATAALSGAPTDELDRLTREKETRERNLSKEMPAEQLRLEWTTPEDLRNELHETEAFVDIIRFHAYLSKENSSSQVDMLPMYVAFVVTRDRVERMELGPADDIDAAVLAWREAIASDQAADDATATLRREVVDRLEAALPPQTKTLYLCPDGGLSRIPWVALPGRESGTILLEDYAMAIVPHGEALVGRNRRNNNRPSGSNAALFVGDVSYSEKSSDASPPLQLASRGLVLEQAKPLQWPPLPGTKAEVAELKKIAGERTVQVLSGKLASTRQVAESLGQAKWAHVATHGFFADETFRSLLQLPDDNARRSSSGERSSATGRNPFLLSGLVLAGANQTPDANSFGGDRGILTAEAIAGLNLDNLRLVVLSACETGLGEVAGGEGVFGLQRAFQIAGARDVVASLWKVDDQATVALMRLFYHKMWNESLPPRDALREAQLFIYRHPEAIQEIASTRGLQLEKVTAKPRSASNRKTAPVKLWAAFLLSGPGI